MLHGNRKLLSKNVQWRLQNGGMPEIWVRGPLYIIVRSSSVEGYKQLEWTDSMFWSFCLSLIL